MGEYRIRESTNIRQKNPRKSEGKKIREFFCVEEILQTDTPHSLQELQFFFFPPTNYHP